MSSTKSLRISGSPVQPAPEMKRLSTPKSADFFSITFASSVFSSLGRGFPSPREKACLTGYARVHDQMKWLSLLPCFSDPKSCFLSSLRDINLPLWHLGFL